VVHAVHGVVIVIVGVMLLERAGEEKRSWMMVDGIERKKLSGTKAKKRSDGDFGRRRRRSNLE